MPNIARILKNKKTLIASVGVVVVAAIAIALFFALRKRGIPGRKESFANVAFKTRFEDPPGSNHWRCPSGYRDTAKSWENDGPVEGAKQCAYMRYKTKLANGKCPDGYVETRDRDPNKACRHARKGEADAKKFEKHELKADGSACTRDNQCKSTVCHNYKCAPWNTVVDDGGYCRNNRWCKSQKCVNNHCQGGSSPAPSPPPASPSKKQNGYGCQDDGECDSNVCYDYKCAEPKTASTGGEYCRTDNWCSSGKCESGKCVYTDAEKARLTQVSSWGGGGR